MRIIACTLLDEVAPFAGIWNELANGVPFRGWAWNACWWRHYGGPAARNRKLLVLLVLEGNQIVAIAPWFIERSAARGGVIRWLGSDEIHSDCLGLLCRPGFEEAATDAIAKHLLDSKQRIAWDQLEIDGVDGNEPATSLLVNNLTESGCAAHPVYPMNRWRLELPSTWEEYLAMVSKRHRKRLRRAERDLFETGHAKFYIVTQRDEIESIWQTFIDLHQKRRNMKGEAGCFISPKFQAFHREIIEQLFDDGQLQLCWLEFKGRRVAVDYQLKSDGVIYVYQAGIDIEMLDESPGNLMTAATVKHTIENGGTAIDFLRGDEIYKPHFRAEPTSCPIVRVVPNRRIARLRHNMLVVGRQAKDWLSSVRKGSVGVAVAPESESANEELNII